eukprot:TRINITY_DN121492_c0_g1_i1.p1 TRINITY_DN121492_c0_g1~~TRINITY_DN121492_c0_g1_i1.p1  ORF type:complete len:506 (-),score=166.98 TRINITY_DN121492_c0_g1_i1:78-1595(-)
MMSSMLPEGVADVAHTVWRTVGVELVIFAVTVFIAIVMRRPVAFLELVKKAAQEKQARYQAAGAAPPVPQEADRSPARKAFATNAARSQQQQQAVAAFTVNAKPACAKAIDEIFRIMQVRPGVASATQALQLYAEMRPSLGLGAADASGARGGRQLADAMRRSGSHNPSDLFSLLVQCAVRSQQCHLVERLIDDMIQLSVSRSCSFYESTMKQLAAQKQYRLALWVYERLQADGLEPSAVTCSCLVSFANEVGEYKLAVGFFQKLSAMTTPSIRAYMTILRVHGQQQDWQTSVDTFRGMLLASGVKADSLALNVVLATGVATDKLQEADELLCEMDAQPHCISDTVSYNTVIKGFARRGELQAARQMVERMKARGWSPNSITFNTLIDAAVRSNTPDQAWELLAEMRAAKLSPDKFTCSIIVRGMATKGLASERQHLKATLELLKDSGSACDSTLRSTLYHSLLEAAQLAKEEELVRQTVDCMKRQRIPLNDSASRKMQHAVEMQ